MESLTWSRSGEPLRVSMLLSCGNLKSLGVSRWRKIRGSSTRSTIPTRIITATILALGGSMTEKSQLGSTTAQMGLFQVGCPSRELLTLNLTEEKSRSEIKVRRSQQKLERNIANTAGRTVGSTTVPFPSSVRSALKVSLLVGSADGNELLGISGGHSAESRPLADCGHRRRRCSSSRPLASARGC